MNNLINKIQKKKKKKDKLVSISIYELFAEV